LHGDFACATLDQAALAILMGLKLFSKIEQVTQKAFAFFSFVMMFVVVVVAFQIDIPLKLWRLVACGPINYFIELTPV
jgi:hypothetical protein